MANRGSPPGKIHYSVLHNEFAARVAKAREFNALIGLPPEVVTWPEFFGAADLEWPGGQHFTLAEYNARMSFLSVLAKIGRIAERVGQIAEPELATINPVAGTVLGTVLQVASHFDKTAGNTQGTTIQENQILAAVNERLAEDGLSIKLSSSDLARIRVGIAGMISSVTAVKQIADIVEAQHKVAPVPISLPAPEPIVASNQDEK